MERRKFLFGGVALAAVGWVGLHVVGTRRVGSPCLGESARATLEAAFEVLLPDGAKAAAYAEGVDTFLAAGDPAAAAQLRLALGVLEHAGLVPFSRRSPEARVEVLRAWERSRWALKRQIFQGLRRTASFSWYADAGSWGAIGYDGPWA
ncbi:MAG: hypothetical protein ACOZNI_05995 [Myxococcota bacterium]